jgi:hypothetical protein
MTGGDPLLVLLFDSRLFIRSFEQEETEETEKAENKFFSVPSVSSCSFLFLIRLQCAEVPSIEPCRARMPGEATLARLSQSTYNAVQTYSLN